MRAIRAASAALLGVAAFALTAPAAVAADAPFGYSITPSTVAPGGRVTLAVTKCSTPATASSGVFDTVTIPSGRTATATVDWDAKAGARYEVTFTCNGVSAKTTVAVSNSARTPAPVPVPTGTTGTTAAVPAPAGTVSSPGGVRGGLGGSIGGMNMAEIVTGTALVVAGITGTVYAIRRRAEHRGH